MVARDRHHLVALIVFVTLARTIRVVPQARAAVVERLGPLFPHARPGSRWSSRSSTASGRPSTYASRSSRSRRTGDHRRATWWSASTLSSTSGHGSEVGDLYEIANYIRRSSSSPVTTLRNVIGGMALEKTSPRATRSTVSCAACSTTATGKWGIRVSRVELKAIDPPASIRTRWRSRCAPTVKAGHDPRGRGRAAVEILRPRARSSRRFLRPRAEASTCCAPKVSRRRSRPSSRPSTRASRTPSFSRTSTSRRCR